MSDESMSAAIERLHFAISAEAAAIGPLAVDADDEPIDDQPLTHAALSEWVLMMSWSDPVSGRTIVTRAVSTGLPRHHESGMLHEGLYNFD
jgi:hypothetical protein